MKQLDLEFPESLLLINPISCNEFRMRFKEAQAIKSAVDVPRGARTKVLDKRISCGVVEAIALLGVDLEALGSEGGAGDVSFSLLVDKEAVMAKAPLGFLSLKDLPGTSKCLMRATTPGHVPVGLFMPNGTDVEVFVTSWRDVKVRTRLRVALYDMERR